MSSHDQRGLRMRLAHEARRIAGQHEQLDALERSTLQALESGDGARMAEALRAFSGALLAHFSLEEQVQFPALHGLDARLSLELSELESDHVRFRASLALLADLIGGADPVGQRSRAVAELEKLVRDLGLHEQREESLLTRAHAG